MEVCRSGRKQVLASLRMKRLLSCVVSALPPHAYEIFPRIAARFAPVADGTLLGRRCHVSCASRAKATASFASAGRPNSSEKCSPIPKGAISSRNMAISVGFFAPPPETIICVIARVRALRSNRGNTNRRTASAIDRAVNAVAVATTSALAGAVADLKKSAHVFPAKFLAARRPRRLLPEKVRAQQPRNHSIQYASRGRDFAVAVIAPCRTAPPSPHRSPCCRGRCQKQPPGAATRPRESPSDSQFRQCSAQCGPAQCGLAMRPTRASR